MKFNMKIIPKTTEKIKGFAKIQLELSSLTFRQKNYKPLTTHVNAYQKIDYTKKFIEIWQKLYGEKDQFFEQVFVFSELKNWHAFSLLHANFDDSKKPLKTPLYKALMQGVHASSIGYSIPKVDSVDTCGHAVNLASKYGFIIGLDTEYQANEAGDKNQILSTQLWFANLGIGFIFTHKPSQRTSLSCLTSLLVNFLGMRIGVATTKKFKFTYVAHFNIAEFASFSDVGRKELLVYDVEDQRYDDHNVVQVLRKSVVSLKPFEIKIKTPKTACCRMNVKVMCEFRDTALIQPTSLRKIGDSIGLPKFDVNDDIERMSELMKKDFNLFLEYGIRDAHITAIYYAEFIKVVEDFGISKVPITSSGLGVSYLQTKLDKQEFKQAICGETMYYTKASSKRMDKTKGYLRAKIEYSPHLAPWKRVYHGGLNACYTRDFDIFAQSFDYDLCNAYPTSMLLLGTYDVDKYPSKYSKNWRKEIKPDDLGMVKIRYKCYDWVKYPPFSWEDPDGKGLIHFLEGEIETTSVELWTALQNGLLEQIELLDSQYYPSKGQNPIVKVIVELIALRTHLKTIEPLKAEMLKLIVNSIYGKYAQGLKRAGMPQSAITNPGIAAQITGVVRACVTEEMNYLASVGHEILSVTTDGYLSKQEITQNQMQKIKQLPLSQLMSKARAANNFGDDILELKHKGTGYCILKTRGYCQLFGEKTLFAKAGVKIDHDLTNVQKLVYMRQVALQGWNREKSLTPKNEIYKKDADLVNFVKEHKRTNLDLDYKRYHVFTQNIETRDVIIKTRPYKNLDEYLKVKSIYERIYSREEDIFKARNLHFTDKRFQAFYLLYSILNEIPEDYRFQSLSDFVVEAKLDDYKDLSVRQVAAITGKSKSVISKWRNERKIRLQDFSIGLQALIADLALDKLPF